MNINAAIVPFSLTKLTHTPPVFKLVNPSERDPVGIGKLVANSRTIVRARLAYEPW